MPKNQMEEKLEQLKLKENKEYQEKIIKLSKKNDVNHLNCLLNYKLNILIFKILINR